MKTYSREEVVKMLDDVIDILTNNTINYPDDMNGKDYMDTFHSKEKEDANWLDLETLSFPDVLPERYGLSERCYLLGADGEIYKGKINRHRNMFATDKSGSCKKAFKTTPIKYKPLTENIF